MKYICNICNKEFYRKSHYDAHNNRKYKCNLKYDINNNNNISVQNSVQSVQDSVQNSVQSVQGSVQSVQNSHQKNDKSYKCLYCNKTYMSSQALSKHKKKHINDLNLQSSYDQLLEENLKLKEENIELKTNFTEIYKEIDDIKQATLQNNQQLCKVSKSKNTNSHNATTNSQNTTTTTNSHNSVTNNINNNLTLNATLNFGDEDISKITEQEKLKVLKSLSQAFINYIQTVNLNENYPEFQNILINNMQNDIGTMVEDNKLVVKSKQEIIDNIISTRLPELEELVDEYKNENKLTKRECNILNDLIKFLKTAYIETEDVDGNIVKGDKETIKKLKNFHKEILRMFYNNRTMVGKNIKKLVVEPIINPLIKLMNSCSECDDKKYNIRNI